MNQPAETCVRRRVVIGNENYYLILGHDWVMATVPFENRPDRAQERKIVEDICGAISAMMEERDEQRRGGDQVPI